MKILKAQKYPDVKHDIIDIPLDDILYIAGENWLNKKMIKYGYEDSFKNAGMIFPITTVYSKDYWRPDRLHSEGLYVVTGHKRVMWAKRNGYTHIEGYKVDNIVDMTKIRMKTKIKHEDIPK
jgi:hypothetical protein|tara:strand:+ start:161 stop:526 length:366 start_codon:yes stop_codon:yes gene_type:complete